MSSDENDDQGIWMVLINHEEQYSLWNKDYGDVPKGWNAVGPEGSKDECKAYVDKVWTDMRPLSLRKKMAEMEARRPELEAEEARRIAEAERRPKDARDDLVGFLAAGAHPVEAGLRPDKTVKRLHEALERGFVHIKFTDTRGGTELGFELDRQASDLSRADFERETGHIHVEGELTLNYQKVRCVADLNLATLTGEGHLNRIPDPA